jgi:hypothetical protein
MAGIIYMVVLAAAPDTTERDSDGTLTMWETFAIPQP